MAQYQNKFIEFINNNEIKTNTQAYIISKILCNKNSTNNDKKPYVWFKLLQIKSVEYDGIVKRQIFILDYFCKDLEKANQHNIGDLVNFHLSDMIGKKCSIIGIDAIKE